MFVYLFSYWYNSGLKKKIIQEHQCSVCIILCLLKKKGKKIIIILHQVNVLFQFFINAEKKYKIKSKLLSRERSWLPALWRKYFRSNLYFRDNVKLHSASDHTFPFLLINAFDYFFKLFFKSAMWAEFYFHTISLTFRPLSLPCIKTRNHYIFFVLDISWNTSPKNGYTSIVFIQHYCFGFLSLESFLN